LGQGILEELVFEGRRDGATACALYLEDAFVVAFTAMVHLFAHGDGIHALKFLANHVLIAKSLLVWRDSA
jgi:hypothetical protein